MAAIDCDKWEIVSIGIFDLAWSTPMQTKFLLGLNLLSLIRHSRLRPPQRPSHWVLEMLTIAS